MVERFVCPYQKTEGFTFDKCFHCKALCMSMGKHINVGCRENREKAHRVSFESAFLLNYIQQPWEVEIVAEHEPKPKK